MKIVKWVDENLEEMVLLILLILITLTMGVQVVARYLFNNSFTWSEELIRYMFVYMSFISVSYCMKKWISIKIDQVIELLPKRMYTIMQLLLNIILFVFFVYLSIHSYSFLLAGIDSGQLSPALGIPMAYVQSAPLVGFLLASIRAFQQIVIDIKKMLNNLEGKDESLC